MKALERDVKKLNRAKETGDESMRLCSRRNNRWLCRTPVFFGSNMGAVDMAVEDDFRLSIADA